MLRSYALADYYYIMMVWLGWSGAAFHTEPHLNHNALQNYEKNAKCENKLSQLNTRQAGFCCTLVGNWTQIVGFGNLCSIHWTTRAYARFIGSRCWLSPSFSITRCSSSLAGGAKIKPSEPESDSLYFATCSLWAFMGFRCFAFEPLLNHNCKKYVGFGGLLG